MFSWLLRNGMRGFKFCDGVPRAEGQGARAKGSFPTELHTLSSRRKISNKYNPHSPQTPKARRQNENLKGVIIRPRQSL